MNMNRIGWLYGIAMTGLIVVFAVWAPKGVTSDDVAWHQATNLFGVLVVLALMVERAQEVVMTVWRAAGSETQRLAIERLKQKLQAAGAPAGEQGVELARQLAEAEQNLLAYRAHTRVLALYLGLLLGVLISGAGFRLLQGLVLFDVLPNWQGRLYNGLDILLTGAVIAGGSDGVHKLAECYQVVLGRLSGRQVAPSG